MHVCGLCTGIVDYNFKCLCAAVSKVMQAYKWTMGQDCHSPSAAAEAGAASVLDA